jgi:PIN domain nuclease of toxin-antitoxin system
MKLLLDTQCWLWWFAEPDRLSENTVVQIADENNELYFSVASIWEMGIKVALGKLPLPEPIESYVASCLLVLDATSLEIRANHALQAAKLPLHHKDPFDRMLIAQAQIEGMVIVSSDRVFHQYDVSILWAENS